MRQTDKIPFVRGKATVTPLPVGVRNTVATFAAVARRAYLYIGNVHPCATEESVCGYLESKFPGKEFIVEGLPKRQSAQSRAFKLTADHSLLAELHSPELRPDGVVMRIFFRPRTAARSE